MQRSSIVREQRDLMKGRAVRSRPSQGGSSDVQFNGRPSHSGDRKLALEARNMAEPDWSSLDIDQLVAAEKLALHRVSGGEASWKMVLERIRDAKRAVEKKNRAKR